MSNFDNNRQQHCRQVEQKLSCCPEVKALAEEGSRSLYNDPN